MLVKNEVNVLATFLKFILKRVSPAYQPVAFLFVLSSGVNQRVACFPLSWVWMALVTPFTYHSSVEVVAETATFPLESDARARLAVRLEEVMVVAHPVIATCFSLSSSLRAACTSVEAMFHAAVLVTWEAE